MASSDGAFLPPPWLNRPVRSGSATGSATGNATGSATRRLRASAGSPHRPSAPPLASSTAPTAASTTTPFSSRRSLLQGALSAAVASVVASAGVGGLATPPHAAAAATGTRVADPASTERTTASGVRLVDFVLGDGPAVHPGDTVSIDYTTGSTAARYGWKIDSTEAGWAGGPGRPPLVFVVGAGQVIAGLDEAVVGMRAGGKRRAVIPPSVGYVGGRGEPVPPGFEERQRWKNIYANSSRAYVPDVIFDVQVVRVRPAPGGGGGGRGGDE
ncbi:hypothetical protein MMPV_002423 [Pyropia vietnamensis]